MKKYQTDIPEEIYTYLLPFCYWAYSFSAIDVKRRGLAEALEREGLRQRHGDRRHLFIHALKWALAHPEKDYRVFLWGDDSKRFTNEDCLKLFGLFLRSLEHLDDEGPDIVEQPAEEYTQEELDRFSSGVPGVVIIWDRLD